MSDELAMRSVYTLRDGKVSGEASAALLLPDHTRPSRVSRAKASTSTIHKMKKPAKGHEAPQPASQSGISRSALMCKETY